VILGFERPAPTERGVYPNIAHHAYHADRRSVSSSGMRRLNRTAPRQFKYELDNPKVQSTKYFDLGTVVHTLVFGVGPEIVVVYYDAWRKDDAKAERQAAWDQGKTPILLHEYEQARAMADAVLNHPIAGPLVAQSIPELSLYVEDPVTGIMMRARPDGYNDSGSPLILVDLKTSTTADPRAFGWSARDFGYDEQDAWYVDVVRLLGLAEDVTFLFIVVAKEEPHLVSVVELPPRAVARGRHFNRLALDRYAECRRTDIWPEFADDVLLVDLPRAAYYGLELQ
jgi:hypothetical protein